MGYVVAAYVVVLGSIGLYWWSLYSRGERLKIEVARYGAASDGSAGNRDE